MAFLQRWLDARASAKMAAKTAGWPTCAASVHEWEFDADNGPAITFAYSYEAEGEYYSGEARIDCDSAMEAEQLGEKMGLAAFTARYSPHDPSKSWVDVSQFRTMAGLPTE